MSRYSYASAQCLSLHRVEFSTPLQRSLSRCPIVQLAADASRSRQIDACTCWRALQLGASDRLVVNPSRKCTPDHAALLCGLAGDHPAQALAVARPMHGRFDPLSAGAGVQRSRCSGRGVWLVPHETGQRALGMTRDAKDGQHPRNQPPLDLDWSTPRDEADPAHGLYPTRASGRPSN